MLRNGDQYKCSTFEHFPSYPQRIPASVCKESSYFVRTCSYKEKKTKTKQTKEKITRTTTKTKQNKSTCYDIRRHAKFPLLFSGLSCRFLI